MFLHASLAFGIAGSAEELKRPIETDFRHFLLTQLYAERANVIQNDDRPLSAGAGLMRIAVVD